MVSLTLSLVLWLAGAQARGQGPAPAPGRDRPVEVRGTERVSGTVIHAETLRPFAQVRVALQREDYGKRLNVYDKPCRPVRDIDDPQLQRFVATDANGKFTFEDVVPGRYYVTAEHEGYLPAVYGQGKGAYSRGMVLAIGSESRFQDLSLRLTPAPTISGRVYNDAGARVPAAVVQLYQSRFVPLGGRALRPTQSIFTDDNGEYRMPWLSPGQYVVSAAASEYVRQPWTTSLRFTANLPDSDNRYPLVYFPGTINPSQAVPVAVGQVAAPLVDIAVWERPRFDVQIRFVGATPPQNTTVMLVPFGGDVCAAMDFGFAPRKGEGVVEIRDVPAGPYMVMAINGRASWSEMLPLIVDQPIRNFPLPIVPPVNILVGGDTEVDGRAIYLNLQSTSNDVRHAMSFGPGPRGFILDGVGPGSYYVTADSPFGYYLETAVALGPDGTCRQPRSINYQYLDQHGHLNRQLPLVVPNVIPGEVSCLAISVARGGQLFGRVVDRTGMPVAGALVAGLPRGQWARTPDSKVASIPPDRFLSGNTDSDGRFVLYGAARGTEYKLFAFEDLDPNLLFDPDLAENFFNRDIIEFERVDVNADNRTSSRGQATIQNRGARSVIYSSLGPPPCSETLICVLKVIPADDTRALNQGR